ncbi:MAG TPA: efflux RND transporter periplasmic adaptor subunit [Verrucomicrobiae bacterium]|jgi:RND family efflux transporter MFP subunit|nr:efflux RND transporter periplasmic adaptor subunit [Verrucomicrobiae bacterium]
MPQYESREDHAPPEITPPPKLEAASPRKVLFFVGLLVLALLAAGALALLTRMHASRVLADTTAQEAIPTVAVVHPIEENPDEQLVLPGTLQAYVESPIYARTNGYLLRWYRDIGSRVKQGELLADIDTPEVDQELMQARAARQQVVAAMDLAKINADRYQSLRKTDSVSQEEADTQSSGYQQAIANLAAADANVKRLEELEGFKHVYAPFDGVITRRTVDPGALINAGAGAAGRELFDIARTDPLRVYVSVPQAYAPAIHVDLDAVVTLQEFPGQKFSATVARTADAIDVTTRSLLTEVDVPNKDGKLLPGSFGEVHFNPKIDAEKVTVPVNAMLFRRDGAQVAVVGSDGKVQLRPISIGRDYGTTLEVVGGVDASDLIIVNPSDSIENGQKVNIAPQQKGGSQS